MDLTYRALVRRLAQGERAVLAVIVESRGSAPRGAGAAMAAFADGSFAGTVGGGAVEYAAQQLCATALQEGRSFLQYYNLSPNEEADLGMVCGGNVTIFFQFLNGEEPAQRRLAADMLRQDEECHRLWVVTKVEEGPLQGCVADENGAVVGVLGSGGGTPASPPLGALLKGWPVLLEADGARWFSMPLSASGTVYIFGGGHVAQKLLPELRRVFFECVLIDDRAQFANREVFPDANRIVVAGFPTVFEQLDVTVQDFIVIMTRGHQFDYEVLAQALKTDARYIGMIGSKTKISTTYTRLVANDGFTYNDIQRVHAPIGLNIGGETPEEIAVGVAAQLVGVRSGRLK